MLCAALALAFGGCSHTAPPPPDNEELETYEEYRAEMRLKGVDLDSLYPEEAARSKAAANK